MSGKKEDQQRLSTPQFAMVPAWVLDALSDEPASIVVLYARMAVLGNYSTKINTNSWQELMEATGQSRATVMRGLTVLRKIGALTKRDGGMYLPGDNPARGGVVADKTSLTSETAESGSSHQRDEFVSPVKPSPYSPENSELPICDSADEAAEKKRLKATRKALHLAVLTACDFDTEHATDTEQARVGKVVKDLLQRPGPPTPEDVAHVASRYRAECVNRATGRPLPLPPESIMKNWNTFAPVHRVIVPPTGEVLERSLLWAAHYNDPDKMTPPPSVQDPFISPDGRPYANDSVGGSPKRRWLDET